METGVTSEPVPAVVGTRASGNRGPLALPTPHAPPISSPEPRSRAVTLATSRDEPPPNPMTPVTSAFLPIATAFMTVASDGSASTSSQTAMSATSPTSAATAPHHNPPRRTPGTVTQNTQTPQPP